MKRIVVGATRIRAGRKLAETHPVEADLVMAIPDSARSAARGYSRQSGIPDEEVLIKRRHVDRSFTKDTHAERVNVLQQKFNIMPDEDDGTKVNGRSLVVIDDSIVRGNTTKQIVGMLEEAGAREIHLRIASPMIRDTCELGMDFGDRDELLAYRVEQQMRDDGAAGEISDEMLVEAMKDHLKVDSLAFLTRDEQKEAIGSKGLCDSCHGGKPVGAAAKDRATLAAAA